MPSAKPCTEAGEVASRPSARRHVTIGPSTKPFAGVAVETARWAPFRAPTTRCATVVVGGSATGGQMRAIAPPARVFSNTADWKLGAATSRFEAADRNATREQSGDVHGFPDSLFPDTPEVETLTRTVRSVSRLRR